MTETTTGGDETAEETVEEFAVRARTWLGETFAKVGDDADPIGDALVARGEDAESYVGRGRMAQRMLFAGGFAGIAYPKEYGGLGLTPAHLRAFSREARGYDLAGTGGLFGMTLGMIGPTLLDLRSNRSRRGTSPR